MAGIDVTLSRKEERKISQRTAAAGLCRENWENSRAAEDNCQHLRYFFQKFLLGCLSFQKWGRCENMDSGHHRQPANYSIWWLHKASWQSTWAIVSHVFSKLCYTKNCCTLWCPVNGKMKAQNFLAKNPTEWDDDPSYQKLKTAESKMKVVIK